MISVKLDINTMPLHLGTFLIPCHQ